MDDKLGLETPQINLFRHDSNPFGQSFKNEMNKVSLFRFIQFHFKNIYY